MIKIDAAKCLDQLRDQLFNFVGSTFEYGIERLLKDCGGSTCLGKMIR